jgi:peptide/nickel transport system permease protein
MYAGQIVESSELEPVFRRPYHPYTEALLKSNPNGAPVGEPLPTIAGTVPPPQLWPRSCHFAPRCRYATPECERSPIELLAFDDDRKSRCVHVAELVGTEAVR